MDYDDEDEEQHIQPMADGSQVNDDIRRAVGSLLKRLQPSGLPWRATVPVITLVEIIQPAVVSGWKNPTDAIVSAAIIQFLANYLDMVGDILNSAGINLDDLCARCSGN